VPGPRFGQNEAMATTSDDYVTALDRAVEHAKQWLESVPDRPIAPRQTADDVLVRVGGPLPEVGLDVVGVVDELANFVEPGLMAIQSGRFFGWLWEGRSLPRSRPTGS